MIESSQLRDIFLMLRKELRDSDIPGCTTIRKRVEEVLNEQLERLVKDMAVFCIFSLHHVALTLLPTEISQKNIIYYGYMVRSQPHSIYGCHSTLDRVCVRWIKDHPQTAC